MASSIMLWPPIKGILKNKMKQNNNQTMYNQQTCKTKHSSIATWHGCIGNQLKRLINETQCTLLVKKLNVIKVVSIICWEQKKRKSHGRLFRNIWWNGHENYKSYDLTSNPRSTNASVTLRLTPKLLSPFSHV